MIATALLFANLKSPAGRRRSTTAASPRIRAFPRLSAPAPGCTCDHGCMAGRSVCRRVTRVAAPRL